MKIAAMVRISLAAYFAVFTAACSKADEASANTDTAAMSAPEKSDEGEAKDAPVKDYLSFAHGAVPVEIGGATSSLKVGMEQALLVIDGNNLGFSLTPKPGGADSTIWFVYRLPAATTFARFSVPNILETPSPSQTFFRQIEVAGSNDGPDSAFEKLASATLTTHSKKGEYTHLEVAAEKPVSWIKVTLSGGISVERDQTFFEFSELLGEGRQEPVPLLTEFSNKWRGRGVVLELKQEGSMVSGCYDRIGDLQGAVSGNLLHATGVDRNTGVQSAFVLTVIDGNITGVRSSNGGPFRLYSGSPDADLATECSAAPIDPPGCGDTLYGVQFDYDSAVIRRESYDTIDSLRGGLTNSSSAAITIVGHTSNEGSDAYNRDLSERRAEAVVTALVERGLAADTLSAKGAGEAEPIADNASETGRSLNRRVEILCQ